MATAVILGAKLQCTCGDAPSNLIVNSHVNNLIDNQLAATIMDHKPGANNACCVRKPQSGRLFGPGARARIVANSAQGRR